MLRITVHETGATWRMQLEGKLAAGWATEAGNVWRSARRDGKAVEIDLTGVTLVDDSGLELLQAMKYSGARFIAKGIEMQALIADMAGVSSPKPSSGCVRHLLGVLALALVFGTLSPAAAGDTESVRQARDRFRAAVANNIEVITAQDELARVNDNRIAALYRYNQSRADLARATGKMEALYTK